MLVNEHVEPKNKVNWKILKTCKYKNYKFEVLGGYSNILKTNYRNTIYDDNIETMIKIFNFKNECIHEFDWYDDYKLTGLYNYIAHFRLIKDYSWWRLSPKDIGIIHIEDDYFKIIENWTNYCERKIDELLTDDEIYKHYQEMTDGLPGSVFIKFKDY